MSFALILDGCLAHMRRAVLLLTMVAAQAAFGQAAPQSSPQPAGPEIDPPLLQLGPGDEITYDVYGQPEMSIKLHVADDGTISIPLAGTINVMGLSPKAAEEAAERALRDGYLVDPHVTISIVQSRNQKVSVLGDVGNPGRYPIDSKTTIFDVLAQAGGVTESGADEAYILRPSSDGTVLRIPVNVRNLERIKAGAPLPTLRAGDSVFVPHAEQFYIYGEVKSPNKYRIEPAMTVIQAIARAGGVTERGSSKRVEIRRRTENGDYKTFSAKASDLVQSEDVIRVKESLF